MEIEVTYSDGTRKKTWKIEELREVCKVLHCSIEDLLETSGIPASTTSAAFPPSDN